MLKEKTFKDPPEDGKESLSRNFFKATFFIQYHFFQQLDCLRESNFQETVMTKLSLKSYRITGEEMQYIKMARRVISFHGHFF